MMSEHEACVTVVNENGWMLTGAFRNGGPESLLAVDVANEGELHDVPHYLRAASWRVTRPCVTIQTEFPCILYSSEQVKGLAQWLLAASIALDRATSMEEFDDA